MVIYVFCTFMTNDLHTGARMNIDILLYLSVKNLEPWTVDVLYSHIIHSDTPSRQFTVMKKTNKQNKNNHAKTFNLDLFQLATGSVSRHSDSCSSMDLPDAMCMKICSPFLLLWNEAIVCYRKSIDLVNLIFLCLINVLWYYYDDLVLLCRFRIMCFFILFSLLWIIPDANPLLHKSFSIVLLLCRNMCFNLPSCY